MEKLSEDPGSRQRHLSLRTLSQSSDPRIRKTGLPMPIEGGIVVLVVLLYVLEDRGDARDYKNALHLFRLSRIVGFEESTQWR